MDELFGRPRGRTVTLKEETFPFGSVGIVGLGLMGGSLARSLKALPAPPRIRGLSGDLDEAREAVATGAVDETTEDVQAFFSDLELVVYCTPLAATLDLFELHQPFLDPGTLITDVASLKAPLLERATSLGLGEVYVGSHPMAGSEETGFAASRAGLYGGARIWMVAGEAPQTAFERIQALWSGLGGVPVLIDAQEHDTLMSWVSHLPQMASTALAQALGSAHLPREDLGPGGLDMTRLAGSSPEMWIDLLEQAPASLSGALEALEEALSRIRTLIDEGRGSELKTLMQQAQEWSKGKPWR
jgi:prephenate dehydrogenase